MLIILDKHLRRLRGWRLQFLALCLMACLGTLDFSTGYEISFSVFYLVPIFLVAWYGQNSSCYAHSVLAALIWGGSNLLAGESHSHPSIHLWNSLVRITFYFITCYLLRSLHALLERERSLSRRDHQTGLLNGCGFEEVLHKEHSRSVRQARPMGLLFIDLDNFKKVNDTLGHAEGDRVLTSVAGCLEQQLRLSDSIARLGGDEFAVILPECKDEDLRIVAAKLVEAVGDLSRREGWPVTASIGALALQSPKAEDKLKALLKRCDELMYRVKQEGRAGYRLEVEDS